MANVIDIFQGNFLFRFLFAILELSHFATTAILSSRRILFRFSLRFF